MIDVRRRNDVLIATSPFISLHRRNVFHPEKCSFLDDNVRLGQVLDRLTGDHRERWWHRRRPVANLDECGYICLDNVANCVPSRTFLNNTK